METSLGSGMFPWCQWCAYCWRATNGGRLTQAWLLLLCFWQRTFASCFSTSSMTTVQVKPRKTGEPLKVDGTDSTLHHEWVIPQQHVDHIRKQSWSSLQSTKKDSDGEDSRSAVYSKTRKGWRITLDGGFSSRIGGSTAPGTSIVGAGIRKM